MSDTCENAQVCCVPPVFLPPPSGLQAQIQRLLWTIPCLPHADPSNCPCATPANQITKLTGDPGELYDVTLLFRGVVELCRLKPTNPGVPIVNTDGLMNLGGDFLTDGHNIYTLEISEPHAIYYLNRWDEVAHPAPSYYSPVYPIRYTATVQIAGGASLTLAADPQDSTQVPNQFSTVAPLGPGDPSIAVLQPYDGQFLQMDAIAIE